METGAAAVTTVMVLTEILTLTTVGMIGLDETLETVITAAS